MNIRVICFKENRIEDIFETTYLTPKGNITKATKQVLDEVAKNKLWFQYDCIHIDFIPR